MGAATIASERGDARQARPFRVGAMPRPSFSSHASINPNSEGKPLSRPSLRGTGARCAAGENPVMARFAVPNCSQPCSCCARRSISPALARALPAQQAGSRAQLTLRIRNVASRARSVRPPRRF